MLMKFHKMSGAGNDFVLISGHAFQTDRLKKLASALCAHKTGIGADGLLYVVRADAGKVHLRYFNSDGSEAFCGNGSRCTAWWAWSVGAVKNRKFELVTAAGALSAEVTGCEKIKMRMPSVRNISLSHAGRYPEPVRTVHFLNTGVPHAVVPVKSVEALDVNELGRSMRFNRAFGAAGANVDFAEFKGRTVRVRTYERGVEAETLACGTGITAVAVSLGIERRMRVPVNLVARSGERFKVWFNSGLPDRAEDIYIEGPAKMVFEGSIEI